MGATVAVLALATGLVIAIKGLPLLAEAFAGRRIEAAVGEGDGLALKRAAGRAGGLAEIGRVLRRLPTAELLALGDGMVPAAAEDERGAQVLAAIAEIVERRDQAIARWARVREWRLSPAAAVRTAARSAAAGAAATNAANAATGPANTAASAANRAAARPASVAAPSARDREA
ncbi:MAG: hypothetical protein JOZ15_00455 [Acidobacteria bacterium]|nr:hypothetical protein [Acidobacteriota bacterium]